MGHLAKPTSTKRLRSAVRPVVEALEKRQLLSVTFTDGTLSIVGTKAADTVDIYPSARFADRLMVAVNGQVSQFREAAVKGIVVDGLDGNDFVSISNAGRRIEIPATLRGGAGHDTLAGAFGDDYIDGGDGKDLLNGNGGNDTLLGGRGTDRLLGGEGDDTINPGHSTDQVSTDPTGNNPADVVLSSSGKDYINMQMQSNFPTYSYTGIPLAYNPEQMRRAYGFGDLANSDYTNRGKGQAIAIIGAYHIPTAKKDLQSFSQEFDLPLPNNKNFKQVYASGQRPTEEEGWAAEALLDIQWAHAIAPEATIILVEADSNLYSDITHAIDVAVKLLNKSYGGGVISMSLGSAEFSGQVLFDGTFNNRNTKNISFVASAGDTPTPSYPATNPNVLAVGGTSLFLDAYGNRIGGDRPSNETYEDNSDEPLYYWDSHYSDDIANQVEGGEAWWTGGGGGCSSVYTQPTWQQNLNVNYPLYDAELNLVPNGMPNGRATPDIAWAADPTGPLVTTENGVISSIYNRGSVAVYNSYGDTGAAGWFAVGGTSAGAPQVAALVALANQARAEKGLSKIGNTLVERIYKLGRSSSQFTPYPTAGGPDAYFNDVTAWNDLTPGGAVNWNNGGFDYGTGWGSPNARSLIPALAEEKTPFTNTTVKLNGQFISYNPSGSTLGSGSILTSMQFVGQGTVQGMRTLNLMPAITQMFNAPSGVQMTVNMYGFSSGGTYLGGNYGTAIPYTPIMLHRDGNTVSGMGMWDIRTGTTDAANALRGYMKFEGTVDNRGRIEGTFYSVTRDGRPIKNVFARDPLNPNAVVTYIKGSFKY